MFADLDETIRQLLIRYVPLDPAEVDVSFDAPDREWSGRLSRPAVNCFLYDVRENRELRELGWDVRPAAGTNGAVIKTKSPRRFDATYQVTAWARVAEDEHRLLWRVLAALARHATLPTDLAQGGLRDQPFPVPTWVAQAEDLPDNPADLWTALDNRIRPALTYRATVALDPQVTFTSPLVFTRVARVRRRRGDDLLAARSTELMRDDTETIEMAEALEIGGTVRGRGDTAAAVAGAVVILRETGAQMTTGADGRFRFTRAPQGPITLVVRAPGRREVTRRLDVPTPRYDVEV